MYADISTVVFSHLVLNDGQWLVGIVQDSNDLTSTYNYQQRVLKRLTEVRREWIEQEDGSKQNVKQEDKKLQSIIWSLQCELKKTRDRYHQQLQQTQQAQQQLQQSQDEIQQTNDEYQQLQQQQQWIRELEQSQDGIQQRRQVSDQYQESNLSLPQQLQQTEQTRQDIGQQLEKLRSQHDQPHWVVGREEVIMTQEVLGKGSYGEVRMAIF